MSFLVVGLTAVHLLQCDLSTGKGGCAYPRVAHAVEAWIGTAQVSQKNGGFPPISIPQYTTPYRATMPTASADSIVLARDGTVILEYAPEIPTEGVYTILGYIDNAGNVVGRTFRREDDGVTREHYSVEVFSFAGAEVTLRVSGAETRRIPFEQRDRITETMPVDRRVTFTASFATGGETSVTVTVTAGTTHTIILARPRTGGAAPVLAFERDIFVLNIDDLSNLAFVYPPVDATDEECQQSLSNCQTLLLGQTTSCPSNCNPCRTYNKCDPILSADPTLGNGPWDRTKAVCCPDGQDDGAATLAPLLLLSLCAVLIILF